MNWHLLANSLLVAGAATLISISFGFVAALWVNGLERRWRTGMMTLAVMSLAMPPFLAVNCWLHYLGAAGVWRGWLPLNIFSIGGAIWILALLTWPITLFMVCGAWRRLEPSQLESDPAITGWALVRGWLAPMSATALLQAAVVTLILALGNFSVPTILQVKVFTEEIWIRFNTAFDTRGVLRSSWPLMVAPLLLLFLLARREVAWPRVDGRVSGKRFRRQLGRGWFWFCGVVTAGVGLLSVGLPLFGLISVKRTWTELPGALAAGQAAVWNSAAFAGGSACVVIVIALAMSALHNHKWRMAKGEPERLRGSWQNLRYLLWVPFLLPGVLLGIALIAIFNRPWSSVFYESAGIVIVAFVIRYLAVGWNTVGPAVRAVDRNLEEVARLSGANRWNTWRHVHWPQIWPITLAAWYVIFLLCLWDVETMILIVPPGGETLAMRIFNLLHYGHNAQVNALCVALLGLAVAPLIAWQVWRAAQGVWQRYSQTAIISTLLILCSAFVLTSCAPSSTRNEASLNSRLFSRAEIIGRRGVGVGELNKPRSVAVDRQDNMFVVDMTGRVQEFSTRGEYIRFWELPQTDKGKPKGMCRDREGNIVVVEPHYQRVNHFSPEGKLLSQWGQYGTNAGQFSLPRAIAINSKGEAFVSEYGLVERIQKFKFGKFIESFGRMGNGPGEFNRPEGLCVDAQDRLYVADSCNHRIQVFSSDGKYLRAHGKAGSGKGELSYPYDICVDAAGRQYVCEFGNSRIQVFDAQDQPLEIIGGPGANPGQFSNPWGVALDSVGNLYVADALNHRVQKLIH